MQVLSLSSLNDITESPVPCYLLQSLKTHPTSYVLKIGQSHLSRDFKITYIDVPFNGVLSDTNSCMFIQRNSLEDSNLKIWIVLTTEPDCLHILIDVSCSTWCRGQKRV
ncbi:hypothetical protein V1478_010664 [Vespula squamosa]|uniref:Uncharacterized protein n=1 Tax=Vespula squamosa TaxID=30214 RepID=A0ABD2AIF1_VESSQ